jgi:hypothetical protein
MHFETITYNDFDEIRLLQPAGWSDIIPETKRICEICYKRYANGSGQRYKLDSKKDFQQNWREFWINQVNFSDWQTGLYLFTGFYPAKLVALLKIMHYGRFSYQQGAYFFLTSKRKL